MKKQSAPVVVVNINRSGQTFNPAEYTVRRADNPELYKFLEVHQWTNPKP